MTSAVAPTRPFPAGCRHSPRRSPAVLSLGAAARRAPTATKCSALASPEKQSTAKPPPPPPPPPATRRAPDAEATDYNEVAAALESIYKLSPALVEEEEEDKKKKKKKGKAVIVRSRRRRRGRRMDLGKRVEMRRRKAEEEDTEEALIREHAAAAETGGFEWRRMSIPPVLSSAQSARLFKLMQPMKAIFEVQENLQKDVEREPTEGELAEAMNVTVPQLRRHLDVSIAARNKLIKHNLRLVLYAINKYYPDLASNDRFDDLCQAGANGLITAIDRFELKRGFRISTYALFWIRHSIVRAITLSSFTRFPFAMESERKEIHKAREELSFELGRPPTEQEIIQRVGISPARYRDILRMTKPIYSLNSRHRVTQEELINEVTDADALGVDHQKHNTLLRLALDDLLDSLKPKESLVIRQRFGLDGKGKRTLGEIAGNLSISREMVRKYELKALIKLKHPTRVDYLRRYM